MQNYARQEIIEAIDEKLRLNFGCSLDEAGAERMFKACALVMRDIMSSKLVDTEQRRERKQDKQVHYLSMEFLLGRSLEKNAFNIGILSVLKEAIASLGYDPDDFFETEPDAALGNGGLGRLAACYLESMTTQSMPTTGYSILYEYGIFRQKIIDGEQQELPDKWLDIDDVWMIHNFEDARLVRFGGQVEYNWYNDVMSVSYHNTNDVRAVPADMLISGFHNDTVNRLRLWYAQAVTEMKMNLFSQGEYLKAVEDQSMAGVITKLLYPEDNHIEGKSLRLRQQYFLASATAQDILAKHREMYGTLKNLADKHVMQINDTHPAVIIPELMRILLDEEGMGWDEAWNIVTRTVCYTNHTVMSEALECWPTQLVRTLIPRVYDIINEISNRFDGRIHYHFGNDSAKYDELSIIRDGQVRMANLCIASCAAVNGVSKLHTEILKDRVFQSAYHMFPKKFFNVTNGIDHRRWLGQSNPKLHALLAELIGEGYLTDSSELLRLRDYANDHMVTSRLEQIKLDNKVRMSGYIEKHMGITVDPNSIFDVQAKRLHEYKRQLLNVMHIIELYNRLREDPSLDILPRTFLFGAKAAPGYHAAKRIIQLINSLADQINSDTSIGGRLKVVFLENYRVSMAEILMPASELSEQISLAGKEASGTGNMKFMINGALTIGTLDGANVEMAEQVGRENMFIFGMSATDAETLSETNYKPISIYDSNSSIKAVLDQLKIGFKDKISYYDIVQSLLLADTYRLLADYDSYRGAQRLAEQTYRDRAQWNRMSLLNIAAAGYFSADRSVKEYAGKIWHLNGF